MQKYLIIFVNTKQYKKLIMANHTLSEKTIKTSAESVVSSEKMTIQGTLNKTYILFGLMLLTAAFTWYQIIPVFQNLQFLWIGSVVGGFALSLFLSFNPKYAPTLAPIYAVIEGIFVASISYYFSAFYEGIVGQALLGTVVTFCIMLTLYKTRIVKVTERLKSIIVGATLAVMSYYLISFLIGMFTNIQMFEWGNSWFSIGFSLFVIALAAFNLLLDFDSIEKGVTYGAPKYMEWYCGFGLLVTVVWLYFEILRLLSKLSDN
ncbi:MAG: Bax inhibitor-1/YccA family protein [Flavobacteriales bacterium]